MQEQHPGTYIINELKKRNWTQKQFANLLGKKISEVNELIKGKRNITATWDILLCALFDTEEQKRLKLQMKYDYVQAKEKIDSKKLKEIIHRKGKTDHNEIFKNF